MSEAAGSDGNEGPERGQAGADDSDRWLGFGPDTAVDVVPCEESALEARADQWRGREVGKLGSLYR